MATDYDARMKAAIAQIKAIKGTYQCECSAHEIWVNPADPLFGSSDYDIQRLVEHAWHDHVSPNNVLMVTHTIIEFTTIDDI